MSKVNIVENMSCVAIICSNLFIFIHLSLTQSPKAGAFNQSTPATQQEIYFICLELVTWPLHVSLFLHL